MKGTYEGDKFVEKFISEINNGSREILKNNFNNYKKIYAVKVNEFIHSKVLEKKVAAKSDVIICEGSINKEELKKLNYILELKHIKDFDLNIIPLSGISIKLKELGVEDSLINLKGITQGMVVTLGEKKIKTLKDFADLSTDELIGGYDEKKGVRFKIEGYLEEFALTKIEADELPEGKNFGDVKVAGKGWIQRDWDWDVELQNAFGEVDADLKKELTDYFTSDMKAKYLELEKSR